eukprot:m.439889 g.439889  ORF g.439889 m.439889 type:complete len:271 (-) comp21459_c0_seq2:153-965(-)
MILLLFWRLLDFYVAICEYSAHVLNDCTQSLTLLYVAFAILCLRTVPVTIESNITYYFPAADGEVTGDAPFTAWEEAQQQLNLDEWMDPCTIGANKYTFMYPNLIDHSSPFDLSKDGSIHDQTDGLSYTLVGNQSLYLYAVLSRQFIVRVPVAWFQPGEVTPNPPFPTPTPSSVVNPLNCSRLLVKGAEIDGVNGMYVLESKHSPVGEPPKYTLDTTHQLYYFQGHWKLAHFAVGPTYYVAQAVKGLAVPVNGWNDPRCAPPVTVTCTFD